MPLKMKPTSVIKARLGIQNGGKIHKFFTNSCYKHMDKYVPKDEGTLRTVVDIENDKIIYEMPYAHYQYIGMREDGTHVVQNYTTPGTGSYWDKRMVSAEMDDLVQEVQDYINRGGN